MRLIGIAALVLCASAGAAAQSVTIERATVPWSELERLIRQEGQAPPAALKAGAPTAWSMTAQINGSVADGKARLQIQAEVSVLAERWIAAPILPGALAVSSARVESPAGRRGLLVRSGDGVAFAADGGGRYQLDLEVEGPLEAVGNGARLLWAPPGLAGGKATLEIGPGPVSGRTAWDIQPKGKGRRIAQAALGAGGLELLLAGARPPTEAGTTLEELRALTVVSLGGTGVTRLTVRALAVEGELVVVLPQGAKLWKAYVAGNALKASAIARGAEVRFPLRGDAEIELAYTFDTQPLGIRGRWRVELPKLPVTVRDARWDVWMPTGLSFRETQAALAPSQCSDECRARTPLEPQGVCNGFSRAVLEPGRAYVEGVYEQPI